MFGYLTILPPLSHLQFWIIRRTNGGEFLFRCIADVTQSQLQTCSTCYSQRVGSICGPNDSAFTDREHPLARLMALT